ncbi:hypothetical protein GC101_12700 [Paenibacillus sp. LMG 31459]|uniref:Uncharacterized protein n=1 Tax=Paenibacillus phytohabitans TaxID=2654978 RepID=A0ABX1YIP1_9BACL|nr:YheC/YheD family protein [Paenibacillus phytohabitans]NOU79733.1 hypothetical protein [Paenibacillus phytohabitans]
MLIGWEHEGKALAFIEEHEQVMMKPDNRTLGNQILYVQRKDDLYEVYDQTYLHRLNTVEFSGLLESFEAHRFVIQKYTASLTQEGIPFHVRVHLMKDGAGQWAIAGIGTL